MDVANTDKLLSFNVWASESSKIRQNANTEEEFYNLELIWKLKN